MIQAVVDLASIAGVVISAVGFLLTLVGVCLTLVGVYLSWTDITRRVSLIQQNISMRNRGPGVGSVAEVENLYLSGSATDGDRFEVRTDP